MKLTQKQINALRKLGATEEEIKDIEIQDNLIDKGGRPDYLGTIEEEKQQLKNSKLVVSTGPKAKSERKKVADENKVAIIKAIAQALENGYENVVVANAETQIDFSIGSDTYSVKLTKHRAAKA